MLKNWIWVLGVTILNAQAAPRAMDQILSVFENGTTEIQYSYIEDVHDGRGLTAGKAGFTTATGDVLLVAQQYLKLNDHAEWRELLPILKQRARTESGSLVGLKSLPALWRKSAQSVAFTQAQDLVAAQLYEIPAENYCRRLGLTSQLAKLILYDAIVQHGDGNDPDSFRGILRKMATGPSEEEAFLARFLKARRQILLHPTETESQNTWRESVGRVGALELLLKDQNWDLRLPILLKVWGKTFRIH